MGIATETIIILVIILHLYFLLLEMFLWEKPYGRKIFGLNRQFAVESKAMAANQGLYNGFLAAGLIWGMLAGPAAVSILTFFLICIIIAGIFGGLTVSSKIIWIQALPAAAGLMLVLL
ncbi:MAG TPA: DUF1304 domain-containing protein [Gammaproteobacteria bacterium]|nr:DUF1304 domain-containing protein [Gammaproteobacteria bacterium]